MAKKGTGAGETTAKHRGRPKKTRETQPKESHSNKTTKRVLHQSSNDDQDEAPETVTTEEAKRAALAQMELEQSSAKATRKRRKLGNRTAQDKVDQPTSKETQNALQQEEAIKTLKRDDSLEKPKPAEPVLGDILPMEVLEKIPFIEQKMMTEQFRSEKKSKNIKKRRRSQKRTNTKTFEELSLKVTTLSNDELSYQVTNETEKFLQAQKAKANRKKVGISNQRISAKKLGKSGLFAQRSPSVNLSVSRK